MQLWIVKERCRNFNNPPGGGMVYKRGRDSTEDEYVVKCCLTKRLRDPRLKVHIENFVLNSSKLRHHGTLLLNHYVSFLVGRGAVLDADELSMLSDQTFYKSAFAIVGGCRNCQKYPELIKFYEEKRALYPDGLERLKGDDAILNAAGKMMATNVQNFFMTTFGHKLRKVVEARLALPAETSAREKTAIIYTVAWCVRGMPSMFVVSEKDARPRIAVELTDGQKEIVQELRTFIFGAETAVDVVMDDKWIEKHQWLVVKFFGWILGRVDELGVKRFNLLPVASQQRGFIAISSTVLRRLMVNAGVIPNSVERDTFNADIANYRKKVFRFNKKWRLGDTIETDGVAICFHLKRTKDIEPQKKQSRKKASTSASAFARPAQEVKPSDVAMEKIIGVDPGVRNMASTVQRLADGTWKKRRLTDKQYYRDSHITDTCHKLQRLDRRFIPDQMAALSEMVGKTANVQQFEEYLATKKRVDGRLWEHRLERSHGLMSMDRYIHKRKTVDRFWKRTVGLEKDMIVAFGDAKFSSSGPGRLGLRSVPTTEFNKAASRFARVVPVDENFTTKKCCECGRILDPIRDPRHPNNPMGLRAVRRCCSIDCSEAPLKSRDWNAAVNIFWRYVDPGRVPWLLRA